MPEEFEGLKWEDLGKGIDPEFYGLPPEPGKKDPKEDPWFVSSARMEEMAEDRVEWLVEGLVPKGAVVLLAAPPGTYKTWLALCIARAVAEGGDFAGRACIKAPVYYIDRENPKALLCGRVRRVGAAEGLNFWPLWSKAAPTSMDKLEGRIVYYALSGEGAFIVFDSLVRFHEAEENSSTEMAKVMGHLKTLAAMGATVLVLHHKGKNESDYRGSSEILAGVQVAWSVRKLKEQGVIELKGVKNRYAPEERIALRKARGARSYTRLSLFKYGFAVPVVYASLPL